MTKKELAELLKYCSPKYLYVVTYKNQLIRLECPFTVRVKEDIGGLKRHETVEVEWVKVTLALTTVFIIRGRAYYYHHFDILVAYP